MLVKKLCVIPRIEHLGGMRSFQRKFELKAVELGVQLVEKRKLQQADALLVIGGTKDLRTLIKAKRLGIPVVQRLDGFNWMHQRRRVPLRYYARCVAANFLLNFIRCRIANTVVYQSEFCREWWESEFGIAPAKATVIHNGVDLNVYCPQPSEGFAAIKRILVLEGRFAGGYELGLQSAVRLVESLDSINPNVFKISIAGEATDDVRMLFDESSRLINWLGAVPAEEVPALLSSHDVLFSSDLCPACPNSVIESLACGTPVLAYDTGSLLELVPPEAGVIVNFGGDPFSGVTPDPVPLFEGALQIFDSLTRYSVLARQHAQSAFCLTEMTERYLASM